ncbi:hypothetical protein I41_36760 [Lacipirellula limnantheis]|uniref:Uncharacterized protein n=2 Tax=Lacipirellula limnantheis TaxID=2528024 RepID=A0A517U1H0_9BACT|nr:hypothetical protein I41_36760 [Lacipirellula limnantheis]
MAKSIRYTLATFCFAASVACLALWWRSMRVSDRYIGPDHVNSTGHLSIQSYHGRIVVFDSLGPRPYRHWHRLPQTDDMLRSHRNYMSRRRHQFGPYRPSGIYFPHWYPALIFALASVGALRFGRRFTLRSAILATTVVAGLLWMAVGL